MVQVVWTKQAIGNLEAIRTYIAQDRPKAAERVASKLFQAGSTLSQQPYRGRLIAGQRRELTHVRPYCIRYRIRAEVVEILSVRHQARKRK